ncbi:hypothetical protein BC939DRAFT_435493 [Gamsiella multidivaricata]|uniref:uncharacterized protein n=1 Tax=Gamsiella multidivaricata TaxID=101098 RepID=UPI00221F4CFB|nr:uncharacterized protein BC939DRAFT_435493 [Gamsiella multidivaricata]KAI7832437.1 hypothetical protein BC939DRAFT_435493 [Gamsiella multidivaricata]
MYTLMNTHAQPRSAPGRNALTQSTHRGNALSKSTHRRNTLSKSTLGKDALTRSTQVLGESTAHQRSTLSNRSIQSHSDSKT